LLCIFCLQLRIFKSILLLKLFILSLFFAGNYQGIPDFMGPSQGSPVRHVHYPNPGTNYNPMSPTNQGVYMYGQPAMSQYPMQSYNMPPMNTLPVHMMPSLSNPEQQSPDPSIQGQENISHVSISGPGIVSLNSKLLNVFAFSIDKKKSGLFSQYMIT